MLVSTVTSHEPKRTRRPARSEAARQKKTRRPVCAGPLIPGGHNWLDLRISDAKVNVADAAQAIPDAVRNAPVPTQNRVVSTTLAPGVVLLGGGSHNSVAVEFKDFVTVIEGPLSNQRTNAVVAEVHKLFPGKPIRYLVNTRNHFDHLGGVRGFVAEGATVITDDKNRNFYTRVVLAPQPRSLQPDRLLQRPFAPTGPGTLELQTFTDQYTISDGNETIELYHVDGLNHSDNMLIAYLPKEKIVVNAELYGPPSARGTLANVNANSVALFRNIKRLKLDVAQHVPIHGNLGSTPISSESSGRLRHGRRKVVAAAETFLHTAANSLAAKRSALRLNYFRVKAGTCEGSGQWYSKLSQVG